MVAQEIYPRKGPQYCHKEASSSGCVSSTGTGYMGCPTAADMGETRRPYHHTSACNESLPGASTLVTPKYA